MVLSDCNPYYVNSTMQACAWAAGLEDMSVAVRSVTLGSYFKGTSAMVIALTGSGMSHGSEFVRVIGLFLFVFLVVATCMAEAERETIRVDVPS